MKYLSAVLFTLIYVVLLLAIYVVHALYFTVNVVFYSALLDVLIAAAAGGLILIVFGARLNGFERVLLMIVWMLGGYAFAITGPTVLDRSLSFYILEKLQQRGGGIEEDRIRDIFVDEYIPEYQLVGVRLTEQLESGTITIENGCVRLTPWGERLATISRYIRTHFLPKERLLQGEYSDVLVDPFKNSATGKMGYECQ